MSAASAAGVLPGEEQVGDCVPAGAADRGRRWIHPDNVVVVLAKPGVVDGAPRRKRVGEAVRLLAVSPCFGVLCFRSPLMMTPQTKTFRVLDLYLRWCRMLGF
ncbi:phosphotransfer protein [Musa troglodytarum]|uniref:Phosphotransfer protein n=1 Tax=Musa troglodytarum TaxID=320322 RepID=A0A9E7FYJ1_9LILI|nr:phosphotransfer protein [Musa troglodytarum]